MVAPWRSKDLLCRVPLELGDRQQEVLGGDVLVFEIGRFFEGLLQQLVDFVGERGLGGFSGDLGKFLDLFVHLG